MLGIELQLSSLQSAKLGVLTTTPLACVTRRQYISTSLECAFSGGGLTDTKAQNQLLPETFEALQILKSCYKDGLITVEEEVAAHERIPFLPVGSD